MMGKIFGHAGRGLVYFACRADMNCGERGTGQTVIAELCPSEGYVQALTLGISEYDFTFFLVRQVRVYVKREEREGKCGESEGTGRLGGVVVERERERDRRSKRGREQHVLSGPLNHLYGDGPSHLALSGFGLTQGPAPRMVSSTWVSGKLTGSTVVWCPSLL